MASPTFDFETQTETVWGKELAKVVGREIEAQGNVIEKVEQLGEDFDQWRFTYAAGKKGKNPYQWEWILLTAYNDEVKF